MEHKKERKLKIGLCISEEGYKKTERSFEKFLFIAEDSIEDIISDDKDVAGLILGLFEIRDMCRQYLKKYPE